VSSYGTTCGNITLVNDTGIGGGIHWSGGVNTLGVCSTTGGFGADDSVVSDLKMLLRALIARS